MPKCGLEFVAVGKVLCPTVNPPLHERLCRRVKAKRESVERQDAPQTADNHLLSAAAQNRRVRPGSMRRMFDVTICKTQNRTKYKRMTAVTNHPFSYLLLQWFDSHCTQYSR